MQIRNETYKVGIYTRLSIDDGNNEESISIDTQKKILTDYVAKQGWQLCKIYIDDGFSGGNFERPDFKRMIQDIENKEINCVVTKDLSRLGRNYLDCGYYLEIFFPEHQVRYIAVNDGVDTISNSSMDITPFKNILNEMYVKDISVKVSSAKKARLKDGKYMTTVAPYGYLKDPQNHNHLIIDDEVAGVVEKIFEMYSSGIGTRRIANYLEENRILRPSEYFYKKGFMSKTSKGNKSEYYWSNKTLLDILSNPAYKGAVVGNKTKKVSPKSKKKIKVPYEQWTVVEDMHEAIVSKEIFENVQRIRTQNKQHYASKMNENRFENIFSRIIRCPKDKNLICRKIDCRGNDVDIENRKYCCSDKCPYKTEECKNVYLRAENLYKIVLSDINKYTNSFLKNAEDYKLLEEKLEEATNVNTSIIETEKAKLDKRLNEINQLITTSYEDKVFKKITEEMFIMITGKYENEKNNIKDRLNTITNELEEMRKTSNNAISFKNLLKEMKNISELTTKDVINTIDKIIVYPSNIITNEDGSKCKEQRIEICYRYIGCITPTTIEFEDVKYKTRYKDRNCKMCGNIFKATTSTQKYCEHCKDIATKLRRRRNYEQKVMKKGGNQGYKERTCILCEETYRPNSSGQKYCPNCKDKGREILKRKWYIKKKEIYQQKKNEKEYQKLKSA